MEEHAFDTTIAALATPLGVGGIAVIRISGPDAERLLRACFVPARPVDAFESHRMMYGHAVQDGQIIDECMAVLMRAPRSYTREDVAEIHTHGGTYVSTRVLAALYAQGATPASPGEFTRRAFLNGRLDLSRAEAVMQLVSASGGRAADAALRQLSGGVSEFVYAARSELVSLLASVEAALDYPEEVEEEVTADLAPRARALAKTLTEACNERAAAILEEGLEVVLCGKPNVGKSSLLNRLLNQQRAIVTDIPGTTRDVIRGDLMIDGVRVHLSDTAGLRDEAEPVERIGVERAHDAIRHADLAVVVLDGSRPLENADHQLLSMIAEREHLVVRNKCDLDAAFTLDSAMPVSARTGEGIPALLACIGAAAGQPGESLFTQMRHMRLAREAAESLLQCAHRVEAGDPLDLCAVYLNDAFRLLGDITGEQTNDDVLDSIFENFCVGK